MKKYAVLTSVALLAGLTLSASAQAHVTVHPNALPAGTTVNDINVPNEQDKASTTKVDIGPTTYTASTAAMPGWKGKVLTKKLAKP